MRDIFIVLLAVFLILVGLAFIVGVPWVGYLLVVKAGGPKYVAVITAIALAMFMFAGIKVKK